MKKEIQQTAPLSEDVIIKCLHDNIIFYAFKQKAIDIVNSMSCIDDADTDMDYQYLLMFDHVIEKLQTSEELEDFRRDDMFRLLSDIFYSNIEHHSFHQVMSMNMNDIKGLASKILSEWHIALKSYRASYIKFSK